MNIEVKVGEVDLSTVIGEHRVYDADRDEYPAGPMTVADAIVIELVDRLVRTDSYTSLRARVSATRDEVIRELITPIIEEAIATPIQPTNGYGEPKGEPQTLTSLIMAEVRDYLKRETGDYQRRTTVVAKFVKDATEKVVNTELAAVIVEEKTKAVEVVRGHVAEILAETMKKGLGGR